MSDVGTKRPREEEPQKEEGECEPSSESDCSYCDEGDEADEGEGDEGDEGDLSSSSGAEEEVNVVV